MIKLRDNRYCCGCSACFQRCPVSCIEMVEDREGFLYPKIDAMRCIYCGLCEQVCPVINKSPAREPLSVYAARSCDEPLRAASSSGGLFTHLSEGVIGRGGVLFGVRLNDRWEAEHVSVQRLEDLAPLRGSKYMQSDVGDSFSEAERYLKAGREVLYSGTPCQIAGLKRYLARDYENLLLVDILCHGVPSAKVWRNYLSAVTAQSEVSRVNFRDKSDSWADYKIVIESQSGAVREPASKNLYMRAMIKGLSLRPSCYSCPSRELKSGSDITLADYWGVPRSLSAFDDDRGLNLLLINSAKGESTLAALDKELDVALVESSFSDAARCNPSLKRSVAMPPQRSALFESIDSNMMERLSELLYIPYHTRIVHIIKHLYAALISRRG